MSADATTESDLMAIGAHLHVQLRRKTGRVIDVEWMVSNADYANAIINLAKASAVTDGAPELGVLAIRFERAMERVQRPRKPLLSALAINSAAKYERQVPINPPDEPLPQPQTDDTIVSEFGDSHRVVDTSTLKPRKPSKEQYIWSLR